MIWFTLFAIPLFIAIVMFVFSSGITLKELGVQILAVCVVAGAAGGMVMCNGDISAVETWNGQIIEKSFHAVDKSATLSLDQKPMQFLHDDVELLQFIDTATYE